MAMLPMPSEVKSSGGPAVRADEGLAAAPVGTAPHGAAPSTAPVGEPPSAKLVVRLFLIPLLIVAAAVGVMFLIGLLAGGRPSFEQSLAGLKEAGGGRTAGVLVGPGAKERYMYAEVLADQMKEKMQSGMSEPERTKLAGELCEIVDKAGADEGNVKHFLLLALGRVWQVDPRQAAMDSAPAVASRRAVVQKLVHYMQVVPVTASTEDERHELTEQQTMVRKAALLAMAYMGGREEAREALPALIGKLSDPTEDLDVRIAAATAIGKVATPQDGDALAALRSAENVAGDENVELVWQAGLSLAELNQPDAAGTVLMLLSREELAKKRYLDRESDWRHPVYRNLSEPEQERFLINTMQGARHLEVPQVQAAIRQVAETDPSVRVREAGKQILGK